MQTVCESSSPARPRGDVFAGLSPCSLLEGQRESLNACYAALLSERAAAETQVPDASPSTLSRAPQKENEKLWAIFDAALETEHVEFLHRYVEGPALPAGRAPRQRRAVAA